MTHDSVPPTQQSKSVSDKATALRTKRTKKQFKISYISFSLFQRPTAIIDSSNVHQNK